MSHAPDTPDTPTSGTHCDEEYSLPCAEALLAGTLALIGMICSWWTVETRCRNIWKPA